jgi:hypothetical protein
MELQDRDGGSFANIVMANNVSLVRLSANPLTAGLVAWRTEVSKEDPTHNELIGCLGKVAMVAMARERMARGRHC